MQNQSGKLVNMSSGIQLDTLEIHGCGSPIFSQLGQTDYFLLTDRAVNKCEINLESWSTCERESNWIY